VQQQYSCDVIVSGAGPVGLFLAAELRRYGLSVTVLERLAETSRQIKAGSAGPGSAELFDQRGLLDEFPKPDLSMFARVSGGGPPRSVGHFAGLWVLRGDPQIRTLPIFAQQREVEVVLERHARASGAVIRRGHEVLTVTDDSPGGPGAAEPAGPGPAGSAGDHPVRVTATGPGGPAELAARFLVGCDGGRSLVRKLAGFDFPGTAATITGRQAIVGFAEPNPLLRGWQRTEHGMVVFGPGPGRILTVEFDGPPADRDAPVSQDEIQASLRRVSGTDVTLTSMQTGTRWTDNTRQAVTYQRGRILLAGDAAHVHPPFGGQGLNLGLQDAANLGWKLAATIAGRAPAGLLDTYTAERHPAAAAALANTRAQVALMRPDPQTSALRALFTDLMGYDDANQHVSRLMTGVDQPYPPAGRDLRADPDGAAPRLGAPGAEAGPDREAGRMAADREIETDDGPRRLYELLRVPGALLVDGSPDGSWSRAAAAPALRVVRAPGAGSQLIRPDGIVAWGAPAGARAGDGAAGPGQLGDAVGRWLGEPAFR
jgi:2-polyprenyl-6-methoxyphenol hydroxylase-like FAD-dependent oxidoreductase